MSLLALLPAVVVLVAVLLFRVSGLAAAAAAMATAVLIVFAAPFVPAGAALVTRSFADAAILTLTTAAMIVPGILFVEATRRTGATDALARLVATFTLSPAMAAVFVAVGLGVAVESMTGMGVSLLVTVPLLLGLFPRRTAIGLSLVGMSLMPWGALGISGIVGAGLAGLPRDVFATWVARTSGPVACCLPLLALWFLPERTQRDVIVTAGIGVLLATTIIGSSLVFGLELAGACGGLAVVAALAAISPRRDAAANDMAALVPYLALLTAVIVQKLIVARMATAGVSLAVGTGRTTFDVLASPGLALLVATAVTLARHIDRSSLQAVGARAWRPVCSIALFMVAARLLVECGAISALSRAIASLGAAPAALATVALGLVSGFVTGSGVTGNALFIPSAVVTGRAFGQPELFASLQNSAAGHAAMASLPVAAILLAALPERRPADDATVLHLGLGLAAVHAVVLAVTALVLVKGF